MQNGTGQSGQAGKAEHPCRAQGFVVTGIGTAPSLNNPTSIVRYRRATMAAPPWWLARSSGAPPSKADSSLASGTVTLVTGTSYGGIQAPGQAPTTTTATTAPATTAPATT